MMRTNGWWLCRFPSRDLRSRVQPARHIRMMRRSPEIGEKKKKPHPDRVPPPSLRCQSSPPMAYPFIMRPRAESRSHISFDTRLSHTDHCGVHGLPDRKRLRVAITAYVVVVDIGTTTQRQRTNDAEQGNSTRTEWTRPSEDGLTRTCTSL